MAKHPDPPKLPPVFVKANLLFEFRGHQFSFENEGITLYGATGLSCSTFDVMACVGEVVKVRVDVHGQAPFRFNTIAMLTAEATTERVYLGLKFHLSDPVRQRLNTSIQSEGYYPTHYIRKYPRIPAREFIPTMPLRAILSTGEDELTVFDIANMSPNGILLHSENPKVALMVPSVRVNGQVEPRGSALQGFDFIGIICRMLMDKNHGSDNIQRYLGIRFTYIPDDHQANLVEILKAVLNSIQSQGLVK